jgi:hypothetical protein
VAAGGDRGGVRGGVLELKERAEGVEHDGEDAATRVATGGDRGRVCGGVLELKERPEGWSNDEIDPRTIREIIREK